MKKQLVVTLGIILVFMASCGRNHQKKTTDIVSVRAIEVHSTISENETHYVGTIEEASATSLSFEIAGNIKSVLVKEGSRVGKGQLLAILDDRTARSAYNAAKSTLDRAQDGYKRAEQVHKSGSLPEVKWVEVTSTLAQAQSMYDIAKKNLEDCRLYAPVSGVVSNRGIEVGVNVIPYQPVMKIVNLQGLVVSTNIPENEISKIKLNQNAKMIVSALDNKTFIAKVDEIGVIADKLSHTYEVRFKIQGNTKNLMPGMVCKVLMTTDTVSSGFEIPNRAIQLGQNNCRYVWKVVDGKAQQQIVSIGDLTQDGVVITKGLCDGDSVIVDGFQKVCISSKVIAR